MDKKYFFEKISELEELFGQCNFQKVIFEKYDHFENDRFNKMILYLRDNYKFQNGKHFPLPADFEDARISTQVEDTYKPTPDGEMHDPEAKQILKDLISRFKVKSHIEQRKSRIKEYHDEGMVFSYKKMDYVFKTDMNKIGGKFKDTFTGEEF